MPLEGIERLQDGANRGLAPVSISAGDSMDSPSYEDIHKSVGKFDFVMANPPFTSKIGHSGDRLRLHLFPVQLPVCRSGRRTRLARISARPLATKIFTTLGEFSRLDGINNLACTSRLHTYNQESPAAREGDCRFSDTGILRCDTHLEDFVIFHSPAFVDRSVTDRQAYWLEKVLAEEHERNKKHPDRIELPD